MKKLLLIGLSFLLLIVGCVFGDTIKYNKKDNAGNYFHKKIEGEFLGIYNKRAFIEIWSGEVKNIECKQLIHILTDDNTSIPFSCFDETYTPRILTEHDELKLLKKPFIGGTFLVLGGIILYFNMEVEPQSFEEYKSTQQLGYLLIAVGGVLVAIGI